MRFVFSVANHYTNSFTNCLQVFANTR